MSTLASLAGTGFGVEGLLKVVGSQVSIAHGKTDFYNLTMWQGAKHLATPIKSLQVHHTT